MDDKILVMGGFQGNGDIETTEIFDDHTKEWRFGPSLNFPRSDLAAVTLDYYGIDYNGLVD